MRHHFLCFQYSRQIPPTYISTAIGKTIAGTEPLIIKWFLRRKSCTVLCLSSWWCLRVQAGRGTECIVGRKRYPWDPLWCVKRYPSDRWTKFRKLSVIHRIVERNFASLQRRRRISRRSILYLQFSQWWWHSFVPSTPSFRLSERRIEEETVQMGSLDDVFETIIGVDMFTKQLNPEKVVDWNYWRQTLWQSWLELFNWTGCWRRNN